MVEMGSPVEGDVALTGMVRVDELPFRRSRLRGFRIWTRVQVEVLVQMGVARRVLLVTNWGKLRLFSVHLPNFSTELELMAERIMVVGANCADLEGD